MRSSRGPATAGLAESGSGPTLSALLSAVTETANTRALAATALTVALGEHALGAQLQALQDRLQVRAPKPEP